MANDEKMVRCPACAHEFAPAPGADLLRLTCPHCEAAIPEEALRGEAEVVEELAPGFRPGQRLGNYVIESILGAGGMAVVFRGKQLSLNRYVAIKILPRDLAKNRLFVERFESEAAVLANLNHHNVVSVIDRGVESDTYFIVMEYVEGETLRDRIHHLKRLPPAQIFPIAEQTLEGLDYAHRRSVVHRDIKPGNIMINRDEVVKIADFGLAHLAKKDGGLDVTRDNQAMGTLKYMAPEQLTSAKSVDCRADLYSFGVCIYEMLTGKLPLGMFKMPSELDPTLDVRWDDVVLRALKMDPNERYATARDMARDIHEIATSAPVTLGQGERHEAEVEVRIVGGIAACQSCGHESATDATACEQCGTSLSDLFDRCPGCKRRNRVDISPCPGCGEDLDAYRAKLRRAAETIQSRAKQLVEEKRFNSAIAELEKLLKLKTREYSGVRENAQSWIAELTRRRDRHLQRTYEAGQRMTAEGRYDDALKIWEPLPDSFMNLGERRRELAEGRRDAEAALQDGNARMKSGDVAGAVAAWEKAAHFWPNDADLRARLSRARIQLGNLSLKRSYLKESREAAARGSVVEALSLCRKVLDLDPNDASALAVLKGLEAQEREFAESIPQESERVIRSRPAPRARREPLTGRQIGIIIGSVAALLLLGFIFLIALPGARRKHQEAAQQLLREAAKLREDGDLAEALRRCDTLQQAYADTEAAPKAAEMAKEMQAINVAAGMIRDRVEAIAAKGDLESRIRAFREYEAAVGAPPISLIAGYRDFLRRRVEELRAGIATEYAQHADIRERQGDWDEALKLYRLAVVDFAFTGEPVASRRAAAQARVDSCRAAVAQGRDAAMQGQWADAYRHACAALNLIPVNADARRLLAEIAPRLTPPEGMVLVPPGRYTVGGTEANPARTVELPYGFFIDRTEVTHARYAEFLRATETAPPQGWPEDGSAPAGKEDFPVSSITWSEAAAYAAWAKGALPAEEEWECAARGMQGLRYPWGNDWQPGAVLGFGPTPVGAAEKDRSFAGAMDMAGNVAEWTATPAGEPAASAGQYVVKGSSWAGNEAGRPSHAVFADTTASGDQSLVLTPDPNASERSLRFRSSIEMAYLGPSGVDDSVVVAVRRWMPTWDDWAEYRFLTRMGDPIGGQKSLSDPRRRVVSVDLSTGCTAVRHEGRAWLEVRDPFGVLRRLPHVAGGPRAMRGAEREAPPPPETMVQDVASAPMRMIGRSGARYVNVGFRTIRPLWTPPATSPPEKAEAAGEK